MHADASLAAAILTGGRGRRMGGQRKAGLEVGGVSILERQLAALRAVTPRIFAVGSGAAPEALDIDVVADLFPDHGALGGIYTAIMTSPCDRTLVVACDMPFLDARLLRHLAGLEGDLVIPRTVRGYEPLCAVYGRACATSIRERLERGALAASALPEGVKIVEVGPDALEPYDPEGLLFLNVNTPHDYARARELSGTLSKLPRDRIMDELGP
jgi:molybdopterin-guanine dinucleotide biosynthesis protein A